LKEICSVFLTLVLEVVSIFSVLVALYISLIEDIVRGI
jgi:hypothetical protein